MHPRVWWPCLLTGITVTADADRDSFRAFIREFGRSYEPGSPEFEERLELFEGRAAEVRALNLRPFRRWTAGLGPLADYREEELQALRGWRGFAASESESAQGSALVQVTSLPEQFNWTSLAALRQVANQGSCGSCWAVTGAVVLSANAEIAGRPRSFSAQELVDCVPNPKHCGGDGGCKGATVELALNYAMHLGLRTDGELPYTSKSHGCLLHHGPIAASAFQMEQAIHQDTELEAVDEQNQWRAQLEEDLKALAYMHEHEDLQTPRVHRAAADSGGLAFGLHGWEKLPQNRYEPLLRAVYEHGPVGVSVAATNWHLYVTGVFDHCVKDAEIDHAVTLIGFGKDSADKFWIIQNSWGPRWGEGGRIRLLRSDTDETHHCGVDKQPEKGTACAGGPAQVRVCGMCGILYDSAVPHFGKRV